LATSLEQQQQQLNKLSAELGNLKKQQSIAKQQSTGGLLKKPDPTTPAGKALFATFTEISNRVIAKQKEYDDLKKTIDEARAAANIVSEVGSTNEALKAAEQGISVEELRVKEKKALQDKKDKDAMAATGTTDPAVFNYSQFLGTLADPNNLELLKTIQADLKKNYPKYYKGGTGGLTDWVKTQAAIESLYQARGALPKVLQGTDLREFISNPTIPGFGSGGTSTTDLTATISNATEAASTINTVFKSVLNRDATAQEIAIYSVELNAAERKNPKKSKKVGGLLEYTGGIDRVQFLTDVIKTKVIDTKTGKPEYEIKKGEKRSVTTQSLLTTINANGLKIPQSQIDTWAMSVENGTDINIVNNQIRDIAANGMPQHVKDMLKSGINLETVYSPYRTAMATVLEIPSSAISLNDPTLRLALGPDKEMTMYDYQKALRKDTRWQYTNNAKEDVFDSVNKVLKDFGFQG
jgi:hypothetical protein